MSQLKIFRDLPGIADITAKLEAAGWPDFGPLCFEVDSVSEALFATTEGEAERHRSDLGVSETLPRVSYRTGMARDLEGDGPPGNPAKLITSREWDEKIELRLREFDEEADAEWRLLGWDVTDGAGSDHPALDTFSLQILCATHGLCGELQDYVALRLSMVNVEEERAMAWARDLETEAARRIENKRDEGPKFTNLMVGAGGRTIRPPRPARGIRR